MNSANALAAFGLGDPFTTELGDAMTKAPSLRIERLRSPCPALASVPDIGRVGAPTAISRSPRLTMSDDLLVALDHHDVVAAQLLEKLPAVLLRQHADDHEQERRERRIGHHHLALVLRVVRSVQVFGRSACRHLVVAQIDRHHVEPLRDVIAVGILDLVRHLVEVGRLERHEHALLGHRARRRRLGMREHVDEDLACVGFLLESAQDGGAAGAEQLDLDAGSSSNMLAIFCACDIGIEQYQTTLPSDWLRRCLRRPGRMQGWRVAAIRQQRNRNSLRLSIVSPLGTLVRHARALYPGIHVFLRQSS